MKHCPACKTGKPRAAFYDEPTRADGLAVICIACMDAKAAGRREDTFQNTKGWYVESPNGLRGSILKVRDDSAVVHFKTARTVTLERG